MRKSEVYPNSGPRQFAGAIHGFRFAVLFASVTLLFSRGYAADQGTDISSVLLALLTNNGAKSEWPCGCSGVVVNRTNGAVTIKVVGLGLWRSSDRGANWQRINGDTISGRDETGWATTA